MRLVCPNCGAQYEVPEDVIPENGRDVQCSNCGDTWFQKHPSQDRELAEELGQPLDDAHWQEEDEPTPEPMSAAEQGAPSEPETAFVVEPDTQEQAPQDMQAAADEGASDDDRWREHEPDTQEPEAESDWGDLETGDAHEESPEEQPAAQPRELPDEVREVLREEAQFEARARADEAGGLETQPDLGLQEADDEASRHEREARERMARMRGQSPEEAAAAAGGAAAHAMRRDLLPDIDEINSTLRKDSERVSSMENNAQVAPAQPKRGGFSRGFLTVIVLFTILVLVYVFAGKIAESVPALRAPLETYVALVNDLRAWIDAKVLALLGWLDGLSSEAPPSGQN
jgi:predicted Zn finger-like uncharacterized protein